jgi:hypothetical protein
MNILILLALVIIIVAAVLVRLVIVPRLRMERRARALLVQYPNAERTSVYLALHSTWAWDKQREIDAKSAEMLSQGWTFLRAMEASPLRTMCYWGGGLTLHFIRIPDSKTNQTA